jgi:hypothetical protein
MSLCQCHLSGQANKPLEPANIPVTIIRKDSTCGIEEQTSGSNVCAFSATYLLGKALSTVLSVWTEQVANEGDSTSPVWHDFALEVAERLQEMTTMATSYEKSRAQAERTLRLLSNEYLVKERQKKLNAAINLDSDAEAAPAAAKETATTADAEEAEVEAADAEAADAEAVEETASWEAAAAEWEPVDEEAHNEEAQDEEAQDEDEEVEEIVLMADAVVE